jgi:hypothetical protein
VAIRERERGGLTVYGRITEAALRLEHRHSDGSWSPLERTHHDAAEHDPERDWARGSIVYACQTCDEQVRVLPPGEPGTAPERD